MQQRKPRIEPEMKYSLPRCDLVTSFPQRAEGLAVGAVYLGHIYRETSSLGLPEEITIRAHNAKIRWAFSLG